MWKWLLPVALSATLLAPLPFTWGILHRHYAINRNAFDNNTFSMDVATKSQGEDVVDSYYAAISATVFFWVCTVLNVCTVVGYHITKRRRRDVVEETAGGGYCNSRQNEEEKRMESRLTIYAIVTALAQLTMACMTVGCGYCSGMGLARETPNHSPSVHNLRVRPLLHQRPLLRRVQPHAAYIRKSSALLEHQYTVHNTDQSFRTSA